MNRRTFVTGTGVVILSGLVGCLGSGDDDGDDGASTGGDGGDDGVSTGGLGGDESDGGTDRTAADAIDDALALLATNASILDAYTDRGVELEQEPLATVRDNLDDAQEFFDQTEELDDGAFDAELACGRTVLAFQELLAERFNRFFETQEEFGNIVGTNVQFEQPRTTDPARIAELGTATETVVAELRDIREGTDALETARDAITGCPQDLAIPDVAEDIDSYTRYTRSELDALEGFLGTYARFFDGIASLLRGVQRFDDAEWEEALDRYQLAETALRASDFEPLLDDDLLQTALSTFAPGLEIETGVQIVAGLRDGLSGFIEAAEMAKSGDVTGGQNRFDESLEQMEELFEF